MSASPVLHESLDDLDAKRARWREEARQWAEERARIMPELFFVLRHSGRRGQHWRVVFETRDRAEAERAFADKAFGGRPRACKVSCTKLCHGGFTWSHQLQSAGMPPEGPALGLEGEIKAAEAREKREAQAARRAKCRIAAAPQRIPDMVRIAPVAEVEEAVAEHEVAAIEEAGTAR